MEVYQWSRCIFEPLPAMGATDSEWRELAYPPRNPRLFPAQKCDCCADTDAPSELVMRLFTAMAASSARLARAVASSALGFQGWNKSRSRAASSALTRSSESGKPATGSAAVKRAMSNAARTVCSRAVREKSDVLALPRHWPR